jgi:HPt (histidine-containing phosphotransfer) domain-containing protein
MSNNNKTGRSESIIVHVDSDLGDLMPGFLEDWGEEVKAMREALEKNDYETIRKLGHNMKGIGGSCGLEVVTNMGTGLEEAAKAMDQEVIRKNLDALLCYLERVEFVYE